MIVKLDDLVAEHLDHLHYLNDILLLQIDDLNGILTDHLLNRLLIPLYIYSLVADSSPEVASSSLTQTPRPRISHLISLFLLSQVFLIVSYDPLVQKLVDIILHADMSIFEKPQFSAPPETLEESLIQVARASNSSSVDSEEDASNERRPSAEAVNESQNAEETVMDETSDTNGDVAAPSQDEAIGQINASNITDEEKAAAALSKFQRASNALDNERPFLDSLFTSLDCTHKLDDHTFIFAVCLIYAMVHNQGTHRGRARGAAPLLSHFPQVRHLYLAPANLWQTCKHLLSFS